MGLFFLMLFGAFLEILGVSLIVPLVSVVMQGDIMKTNQLLVLFQLCMEIKYGTYMVQVLIVIEI